MGKDQFPMAETANTSSVVRPLASGMQDLATLLVEKSVGVEARG